MEARELNNNRNYTNNIDIFFFLRAIAILCIFYSHSWNIMHVTHKDIIFSSGLQTPAWGGIWILFVLSGYLIGKGFYNQKYKTDIKGIFVFWLNRIVRIVPMYFFLLLIIFLFIDPNFFISNNLKILIPLLTFTYNGGKDVPSMAGVGATWFISTLMQLYFLAPLFYKFIFSKIKNHQNIILFFIILLGLGIRLLENLFHLDWYQWTYVLSLSNLDLFFAGFFLNSITQKSGFNKFKLILKPISIFALFTAIGANALCIYYGKLWFYKYIFASIYLVITLIIIYACDYTNKAPNCALSLKAVIKNPSRLVEGFGIISFTFYLFHSNLLTIFSNLLTNHSPNIIFWGTIMLVFVVTTLWSIIIYYAIEKPINNYRINFVKGIGHDKSR